MTSKVATLVKDQLLKYKTMIINSTKFSLMGNLIVSEEPGPSEVGELKTLLFNFYQFVKVYLNIFIRVLCNSKCKRVLNRVKPLNLA